MESSRANEKPQPDGAGAKLIANSAASIQAERSDGVNRPARASAIRNCGARTLAGQTGISRRVVGGRPASGDEPVTGSRAVPLLMQTEIVTRS